MAAESELTGHLDATHAAAFAAGGLSAELRASIEEHVDDCASCRKVLAALVRGDTPPEPAGWAPGKTVGRYVILARIGQGAMGAVYRAEDVELGRPVALKRLYADERERLVREARAVAPLSHPNIVTVYEVGEVDGAAFLAMELVEGTTLRAWLADRPRSPREIARVIADAGRGLAAAHDRGIVHRDFKPDNVLVDRAGRVRVADFGLARPTGAAENTGTVAGTPAYMAPEVVAGAAPDAKSDQYALAVTLFAALHSAHPFDGDTPRRMWVEMAHGRIRASKRDVPAWLDRIARRGLAVDPAARYPDVASMIAALERPPRKKWPWFAGAGGAAAIAAVAFVVARKTGDTQSVASVCDHLGGELDEVWPASRPAAEQKLEPRIVEAFDALVAQRDALRHDACLMTDPDLARRQSSCMIGVYMRAKATVATMLAHPADAPGWIADVPDATRCGDRNALSVVSAEAAPSYAMYSAYASNARQQFDAGDLEQASRQLGWAVPDLNGPQVGTVRARALALLVEIESELNHGKLVDQHLPVALTAARATGDPAQSITAELVAHAVGNPDGTRSLAELAAAIAKLPASRDTVHMYALLGAAQLRENHPKDAEAAFRIADGQRAVLLPTGDPERAVGAAQIADAIYQQGRIDEARPLLVAAKDQLAAHAGGLRREAITVLRDLANLELVADHADRAAELSRDALNRSIKRYGDDTNPTQTTRIELISALDAKGDHAAGDKEVAALIAAIRPDGYSAQAGAALVEAAGWFCDIERYDDAEKLGQKAVAMLRSELGPEHPNVAITEYLLFRTRTERPVPIQLDEAKRLLDHMEPIFLKRWGEASEAMLAIGESRADLLALQHQGAAADRAYIQALAMLAPDAVRPRASLERSRAKLLIEVGRRDEARVLADAAVRDFASLGPSTLRELAKTKALRASIDN